jgi:hypothetical protein
MTTPIHNQAAPFISDQTKKVCHSVGKTTGYVLMSLMAVVSTFALFTLGIVGAVMGVSAVSIPASIPIGVALLLSSISGLTLAGFLFKQTIELVVHTAERIEKTHDLIWN